MSAAQPTAEPLLTPTIEEQAQVKIGRVKISEEDLLTVLRSYWDEAREARASGPHPRDPVWSANWDAYWSRYDAGKKAEWQAQSVMPEVPNFVDRFVASLRVALTQAARFFEIRDLSNRKGLLTPLMTRFVEVLLERSGTNTSGQPIGFESTFGEAMKAGAMMMIAGAVSIKDGRVRVEAVDPREIYLDPKGRGLYRIRHQEKDFSEVQSWKKMKDSRGRALYKNKVIDKLASHIVEENKLEREMSSGHGQGKGGVWRKPIMVDEYLCTIIDLDGKMIAKNQLIVVANEKFIIRGPEKNPFWHGKDWIVVTPTIQVPFSVYGRSYVEGFRQLADTFTEITNLIIDSGFSSAIKAHMVWEAALADTNQIQDGIAPGLTITADEDWPPGQDFVKSIESGDFSAALIPIWQAMKAELREGAGANELSLGQVPPKGDITATEIDASTAGSNTLNASLARDVDTTWLSPILELVFMTGLQHFDPEKDPELAAELGEELSAMIVAARQDLRSRKFSFVADGLSSAIRRGSKLKSLLGALNVIGGSETLARAFLQNHSIEKLIEQLLLLFDIDPKTLEKTEQEKKIDLERQVRAAQAEMAGGGPEAGAAATGSGRPGLSAAEPVSTAGGE